MVRRNAAPSPSAPLRVKVTRSPQQKTLRLEAHVRDAKTGVGRGRVMGFAPGTTFELTNHPMVGVDGGKACRSQTSGREEATARAGGAPRVSP